MVENLPANAGDTGSSPGLGRSHVPRSNYARAPQLLSLRSRAFEPQLLKPASLEPMFRNTRSHCNEKPIHRNEEWPPIADNERKSAHSNENPAHPKINK